MDVEQMGRCGSTKNRRARVKRRRGRKSTDRSSRLKLWLRKRWRRKKVREIRKKRTCKKKSSSLNGMNQWWRKKLMPWTVRRRETVSKNKKTNCNRWNRLCEESSKL
uniref:(northern house mosquito) hypothetical protein n=1 Tax=Culex pipiens TaxID=7175 RepID=A0A8D8A5B5_CULPI